MREYFRAILRRYQLWLIERRTAKLIAEIDDITARIEKAKRSHRTRRDLETRRRKLTGERLAIEVKVLNLF